MIMFITDIDSKKLNNIWCCFGIILSCESTVKKLSFKLNKNIKKLKFILSIYPLYIYQNKLHNGQLIHYRKFHRTNQIWQSR